MIYKNLYARYKVFILFFFTVACTNDLLSYRQTEILSDPKINKGCEMNITMSPLKVRQIGDSKLHTIPSDADPTNISLIQRYITILQDVKELYGGVGIACNQCLEIDDTKKIFLVGISDAQTRKEAQKRYPNEKIPYYFVMINPTIIDYSKDTYYPINGEGCLSVYGPLRGKVKRHNTIKVRYQDITGQILVKTFSGFEAHIIQHEYDHLQGIVFLEKIFKDCTKEQKQLILTLVEQEIDNRKNRNVIANNKPVLVFDRDEDKVIFQPELLASVLEQLNEVTLVGIRKYAR